LARVTASAGSPYESVGSRLDLGEDHHRAATGDDVDLAARLADGDAPVPIDDLVAVRAVPARRLIFAPAAAGLAGEIGF